jgi:hypothetical protein
MLPKNILGKAEGKSKVRGSPNLVEMTIEGHGVLLNIKVIF